MATRIYRLSSSTTSTATIQLDIRRRGTLKGITFCGRAQFTAITDHVALEVSFTPTAQNSTAVNDGLGTIALQRFGTTVANSNGILNSHVGAFNIPVEVGTRFYGHIYCSTTVGTPYFDILLHVDE